MAARRSSSGGASGAGVQARVLVLVLMCGALSAAAEERASEPAPQELVFWNARLALREQQPKQVLQLWMLHNALADIGHQAVHEDEFRSVVWAALGDLGYCPDGFDDDEKGSGLWPLALHNWLLKSMGRSNPSPPPPSWGSFAAGMQQRRFSLHDVLSAEELKTMRFFRSECYADRYALLRVATLQWIDRNDRFQVGLMMRDLLELAGQSLRGTHIEGRALLETRRFDLEAALTRIAAARARAETAGLEEILRAAGVGEGGTQWLRLQRLGEFSSSSQAELWSRALAWPAAEWLSLSPERRLSLFAELDASLAAPRVAQRDVLVFSIVDELIARRMGAEVESWLAFAKENPRSTGLIRAAVDGSRGERLLGLDENSGFRERSVVALHRGVHALQEGSTLHALRSFAFALGHAASSRDAEAVHSLAQRWLAFVLGQFETSDEVLAVLDEFVPPLDLPPLLEVLLWRAAFAGDAASFERAARRVRPSGSLARTVEQLRPLARGDTAGMWREVTEQDPKSPALVVFFSERLLEQLALEPLDVRRRNAAIIEECDQRIAEVSTRVGRSLKKKTARLEERARVLLDGIGQYDESIRGRAASSAPDREAYAGSVRLAPADELPWPFAAPRVEAPNPYAPLHLTPTEWRSSDGNLLYGWRIHE